MTQAEHEEQPILSFTLHATQLQSNDEIQLEKFGYKQQLKRTLGLFSSFGLAFSYISPVVGVYSLFGFGLSTIGPVFIWSLPFVVFGQLLVALVFCKLSVTFPLAGALYQWCRRLVGEKYGWFVGWLYQWALLITVASIDLNIAPYVYEIIGISNVHKAWDALIAICMLLTHTLLNLLGVKITGIVTTVGLICEVIMTIALGTALFATHPHQPADIIVSRTIAQEQIASWSNFLPAMLSMAFVFFGFESAADVSEEVIDPRAAVPKAMMLSLGGASVVTAFLTAALIFAIPDLSYAASLGTDVIPYIIEAHLGKISSKILCILLVISFISCSGAVQAACARQIFSYARDDQLPGMKFLANVSSRTQVPIYATILTFTIALFIISTSFIPLGSINMGQIITNYAVAGIYIAFQSVVFARIWATLTGQDWRDEEPGYFSMGKLSLPVAIAAQVYGVSMIVNVVWPRPYDSIEGYLTLIAVAMVVMSGLAVMVVVFISKRIKTGPKINNIQHIQ
jgi:amino acid transporter